MDGTREPPPRFQPSPSCPSGAAFSSSGPGFCEAPPGSASARFARIGHFGERTCRKGFAGDVVKPAEQLPTEGLGVCGPSSALVTVCALHPPQGDYFARILTWGWGRLISLGPVWFPSRLLRRRGSFFLRAAVSCPWSALSLPRNAHPNFSKCASQVALEIFKGAARSASEWWYE